MAEINMGSLYEVNKSFMDNLKPIDKEKSIEKFAAEVKDLINKDYLMLLCNDRRDFSIILNHSKNINTLANELYNTMENRGKILSIDLQKDGAVEIWVREYKPQQNKKTHTVKIEHENYVYYLFDYTNGIIEV